jgi:hypothetical protein
LKEHQAGLGAKDLCRKHGLSDLTFYEWRAKFGGMEVSDAKKLKGLEAENTKLKKLVCRADDGRVNAQGNAGKKLLRPGAWCRAVNWAMTQKGYRQRRACALAGIDPRVYRRPLTRSEDTDLPARLKEL